MRRVAVTLVAIALAIASISCDKPQGTTPQGPAGDVAREVSAILAPSAQFVDKPFEDLIARLDLAKTYGARAADILDQIRKTRLAVEKKTAALASGGSRLTSVANVVGTFSFAAFRHDFAFQLDDRTDKGGSVPYPPNNFSATESGKDTTTTTTLAVTQTFTGSGSVVTATLRWTYSQITIDTSPTGGGATLLHLQDDREFEGKIDVCPDAGGSVPASLHVTSKIVAEKAGETTRRTSDGNSTFKGNVNEQASLTSVSQVSKVETSTETASGMSGNKSTTGATWNASSTGLVGNLQNGSFTATIEPTGTATLEEAAKAAGWDTALGIFAVEDAYFAARDLWQKGRCVVVAVTQWRAETSIKTHEQQKVQHDEEVDVSSDTKFTVELKHRFAGGTLNKPTMADLTDGKEKISPNKLDSGGGSLTYKAGDEEDKEATAQLKSTSNRGTGTLVLKFHTAGKNLTLSVQGIQEIGPTAATLRSTVSIGPAKFTHKDDKWEATAPFSATSVLVPPDPDCPDLKITGSGTLKLVATIETRGEQRFWVVTYGPGGSSKVTGTGCDEDVTQGLAAGGGFGAGLFLGDVGDIVIPIDGGTVRLQGSRNGRSSGTATATVTKKN